MAEFRTPFQKKNSEVDVPSVFMTPSSSCGRPVFHQPRPLLTSIPSLSFASPATTPISKVGSSVVGEEHKDILGGLYEKGCPEIADEILSLLSPKDISSCLLVCRFWQTYISQRYPPPTEPLTDENSRTSTSHSTKSLITRPPLATISSNAPRKHEPQTKEKPSIEPGQSFTQMRPCPQCQSPAKKLNLRRAECTKCQFDYCLDCFHSWHPQLCGGSDVSTSPKKSQNSVTIAGTKKAKKRLKRL